jgi:uncharacterized protein (UPF0548 family)
MFSFRRPTDDEIRQFLRTQANAPLSYAEVGMSAGPAPAGYVTNHHRSLLGKGEATFLAAAAAIRRWAMFDVSWVTLCGRESPIEVGSVVGILVRRLGIWSLNACRIVETIDESGDRPRFGFRYGTLPEHVEQGEEQFLIEWDRNDDTVWYELKAHSRAGHWLSRWGRPVLRHYQRLFGRMSLLGMQQAIKTRASVEALAEKVGT